MRSLILFSALIMITSCGTHKRATPVRLPASIEMLEEENTTDVDKNDSSDSVKIIPGEE